MRIRRRRVRESTAQEQLQEEQGRLERVRRLQLRQVIFWLHLGTGLIAGLVIGVMSITGVLLAFERQILDAAERHLRTVQPPVSGAPRLDLDAIVAQARAVVPEGRPSGVTLRTSATEAALVNFGRERVVFVDPYSGAVLSEGAQAWRSFFHVVTDWHRWLGTNEENRDLGRAVTGACNAAFAGLALTGVYLWWPRRWTRQALKAITVPAFTLRGKPRDWNWHNVTGFWSAAILLCIALTGVVMSYPWANDLIYTLTGNTPPPRQPRPSQRQSAASGNRTESVPRVTGASPEGSAARQSRAEGRPAGERQGRSGETGESGATPQRASLQALFTAATQRAPHWRSMTLRLPQRGAAQMTVMLEEATALHPYPRSILTLDAATAAVVQWDPYGSNLGRTIRSWVRPLHTGEAGGLLGQIVAALTSAGGVVLVWTGFALAWRRFFGRNARSSRRAPDVTQL